MIGEFTVEDTEQDRQWAPRADKVKNPCCAQASNLQTVARRERVQVRQCTVCGSRHYRALLEGCLEPGVFRAG